MDIVPKNPSVQRERLGVVSTAQRSLWERRARLCDHWEVKERTW